VCCLPSLSHPLSSSSPPPPAASCCLLCPTRPNQIREFLEKHYADTSGRDTIKLAIRALMETVEASSKNVDIAVMERGSGLRILEEAELDGLVAEVEAEKAAAEAAKRSGRGGGAAAGSSGGAAAGTSTA
jgi:hypothetical protein